MQFLVDVPSGLVHYNDKDYVEPKEMARVLRSHIAHMGNINITVLGVTDAEPKKFKGWFNDEQRAAWNSHDWDPNQTECPTCLKCGLTPISAHLWGDDEWVKYSIACGLGTVKVR